MQENPMIFMGTFHISRENLWFPVDFPLSQPIEDGTWMFLSRKILEGDEQPLQKRMSWLSDFPPEIHYLGNLWDMVDMFSWCKPKYMGVYYTQYNGEHHNPRGES